MLSLLVSLACFLPLVSALVVGLWCQSMSNRMAYRIANQCLGWSLLCGLWAILKFLNQSSVSAVFLGYTWGRVGDLSSQFGFWIDATSLLMLNVVLLVSWMVHIYSVRYMKSDPGYNRFFSYLGLFTFMMLNIVLSPNWVQLFMGWEGVGCLSYLLIGFWYERPSANQAAFKAFLINRIGDLGLLIAMASFFKSTGQLEFAKMLGQSNLPVMPWCAFGLILAAMAKSAQIPLHVWLPDSMEGPTPISALIHAATMVTAGIFILIRFSPILASVPGALGVILIVGSLTAFFTGLLALFSDDIKRIIAFSTLSQLGYMMLAIGVNVKNFALFHVVTHAFFKALLFLGAGSVILAMHHQQDIRQMGGLRQKLPITYWTFLIASLALIGFPGFSGFFSKDLILEALVLSKFSKIPYYLAMSAIFVTTVYSFRLLYWVFWATPKREAVEHATESGAWITGPLMVLAGLSLMSGWVGYPFFVGAHSGTAFEFLKHGLWSPQTQIMGSGILVGILIYFIVPNIRVIVYKKLSWGTQIFIQGYFFDALYQRVLTPLFWQIANWSFQLVDRTLIEGGLISGTCQIIQKMGVIFRALQTGFLVHYIVSILCGLLFLSVFLSSYY